MLCNLPPPSTTTHWCAVLFQSVSFSFIVSNGKPCCPIEQPRHGAILMCFNLCRMTADELQENNCREIESQFFWCTGHLLFFTLTPSCIFCKESSKRTENTLEAEVCTQNQDIKWRLCSSIGDRDKSNEAYREGWPPLRAGGCSGIERDTQGLLLQLGHLRGIIILLWVRSLSGIDKVDVAMFPLVGETEI